MSQLQSVERAIRNITDRKYGDPLEQLAVAEKFRYEAKKAYDTAMNRLKKDDNLITPLNRVQQIAAKVLETLRGERGIEVFATAKFRLICDVKTPSLKVDRELVRQHLLTLAEYDRKTKNWIKINEATAEKILAEKMCSYTNPAKEFHVIPRSDVQVKPLLENRSI